MRRGRGRGILSDNEVLAAVHTTRALLGESVVALADSYGVSFEDVVRYAPLGRRCKQSRESRGLSVKEVARHLKVHAYRVTAIERGSFEEIRPDVFRRYVSHLGLDAWVRRWKAANRELAHRLGIARAKRQQRSNIGLQRTASTVAGGLRR